MKLIDWLIGSFLLFVYLGPTVWLTCGYMLDWVVFCIFKAIVLTVESLYNSFSLRHILQSASITCLKILLINIHSSQLMLPPIWWNIIMKNICDWVESSKFIAFINMPFIFWDLQQHCSDMKRFLLVHVVHRMNFGFSTI